MPSPPSLFFPNPCPPNHQPSTLNPPTHPPSALYTRWRHGNSELVFTALPSTLPLPSTQAGEHGNAELVSKYGFALRQNPFTAVCLGAQQLLAAASTALGERRCRQRCRFLRCHSQLLDEADVEPLEALPNGHISPALFVLLRVLAAADAEAQDWQGVEDALLLPGGQHAELGAAVQLWPVLDAHGQRLPPAEAAATAAAAVQQPGALALVTRPMCELLAATVQHRLAQYPCSLADSLAQLAGQQQLRQATAPGQQLDEHDSATLSALLLRVTEQELLEGLLQAAKTRLVPASHAKRNSKRKQTA